MLTFLVTLSIITKIPLNSIWLVLLLLTRFFFFSSLFACMRDFFCLYKKCKFSEVLNSLRKFNKLFVTKILTFSNTVTKYIFSGSRKGRREWKKKLIHISLHESNSYSSAVERWNIMREKKKYHQIFVCYYYDFFVVVVKILVGAWSSFMCNKTPLTNVWHTFYILKYHIHCVYVFFWSLWSFSIPLHFVAHACLYDTLISIASRFFLAL